MREVNMKLTVNDLNKMRNSVSKYLSKISSNYGWST